MDNCSVHHVPEVKNIFMAVGIPVFFLPAYSPDYNPIEETFSYVKTYLESMTIYCNQSVILVLLLKMHLVLSHLVTVVNG